MDVLTSDKSGLYRMVISYWDMACSFVNNGAIDAQMFNDANGEHIFVYAKMEPFIPAMREQMGAPQFLAHLEKTVKALPDCEERLAAVRQRMQAIIAKFQERAAAAAAATN
jgi:agmatine/peptidylarginine deiminase